MHVHIVVGMLCRRGRGRTYIHTYVHDHYLPFDKVIRHSRDDDNTDDDDDNDVRSDDDDDDNTDDDNNSDDDDSSDDDHCNGCDLSEKQGMMTIFDIDVDEVRCMCIHVSSHQVMTSPLLCLSTQTTCMSPLPPLPN